MFSMNDVEVKSKLRSWIISRSKQQVADHELTDDTPVIESGYLSSLDVVELILYIESLLDDEIEIEDLEPEVFTSTNTIYATFFAQDTTQ